MLRGKQRIMERNLVGAYEYLERTLRTQRRVPTVSEIGEAVGVSRQTASRYLKEMEARQWIFRLGPKRIVIIGEPDGKPKS